MDRSALCDPSWTRRGIGTRLLSVAKRSRPEGLQLWTFQSNDGAHRFYERHGFKAEERTDGSRNQERTPNVRYVWDRRVTSVDEIGAGSPSAREAGLIFASDMADYMAANRQNWNDRVSIHVASKYYDVEGWLRERPGPRQRELDALGDVGALDVVHLQCHFGLDTLAFANAGALVTGVDFSDAAIAEARSLAERAGLARRARFVQGDVLEAADLLAPERYDIVYVSLGALCWLPSVSQWAGQVAALLRPGGRLYLHDGHPLAWALADDDLRVVHSYFEELQPHIDEAGVTYTDGEGRLSHPRQYEWNHSIGEIVTAVIDHGLRIVSLTEHDWTVYRRFPWLVETVRHRWETPPGRPRIPLTFTLIAASLG